jgi:predicted ArsR family transcriptional regulator
MRDRPSALAPWIMTYLQTLVRDKPGTYYYVDVAKLAKHLEVHEHSIRNILDALSKWGLLIKLPWDTRKRWIKGSKRTYGLTINRYKVTRLGSKYETAVPIFLNNMQRTKKELEEYLAMKAKVVEAAEDKTIGSIAHTHDREYRKMLADIWGRRWVRREFGPLV